MVRDRGRAGHGGMSPFRGLVLCQVSTSGAGTDAHPDEG